jgi:5-formaminoimidazole-4-carboxamide-1-beta-D-ribofuranosyl 5'-monophosphate synthetase
MTTVALLSKSKKLADLQDAIELQLVHVEHARGIHRKFHDNKSERDLKKKMEQLVHLRNIYQERKN